MTGNTPQPITDAELDARMREAFGSPIEGSHQVIRVDRGRDPSADDLFWEFQHQIDVEREYQFDVERGIERAREIMWWITIALGLFMAVVVIVAAFW